MFSRRRRRITSARFPHSGIHGSKAIQRLTVAYRSRSRPSSTLGAKASTMCPYYLDGDRTSASVPPSGHGGCGSVIPVAVARAPNGARVSSRRRCGYCAVFKVPRKAPHETRGPVSQNSTACSGRKLRGTRSSLTPGPVDILGRTVGDHHIGARRVGTPLGARRKATSRRWRRAVRAPLWGSLERR